MAEKRVTTIPEKYKGRTIYSFSRISSFSQCPQSYFLGYILKKDREDNIYALIGTLMHDLTERLQHGQITKEEALEEFNLKIFEITEILGYKFISEKVKKNLIECLTHFIKNFKPVEGKCRTEVEFYTEIEGAVILGYIDLIALFLDGTVEVHDYKVSSKYTKDNIDEHGLQLLTYAVALENEYNIKVSKVKWNMLKYCTITWQGKTAMRSVFCLRNEIVKSLRSEIKKDLRGLGYIDFEIDMMVDNAQEKNDLFLLPNEVTMKYNISDGYVEYDITEEHIQMLKNFIGDNVRSIESKSKNPFEWKSIEITDKNNFFCSTLCSYRKFCESYKKFVESYKLVETNIM